MKVCVAQDLDGSYEESPPTLIDYAQRDQRWCQGNMQHIRLVFSYGLVPMSRLHLGMGAMAYLSSPLWLMFMILSSLCMAMPLDAGRSEWSSTWTGPGYLFAISMTLLLLPKLWGYLLLLSDRRRLAGCGGALKALGSVLLETLLSILVAPIMMAFHVVFVSSTLLGVRVSWCAQERSERGQRFVPALAAHWKQTVAGLAAAVALWLLVPDNLPWLAPVLAGLLLAIPLSMIVSSVGLGQALAHWGFLITPAETSPPSVLRRLQYFLGEPVATELRDPQTLFGHLLTDPAFAALHRSMLLATGANVPAEPRQLGRTQKLVGAGTLHRVSMPERKAIQSDPAALQTLHLEHWASASVGFGFDTSSQVGASCQSK
jgi:membrane glycosyltransferase